MKYNIGILLFTDIETLDFAGPFEVFSVASELNNFALFNVFTVAKTIAPVKTVHGLSVNPHFSFVNCPHIDILIIPGGVGTRALIKDEKALGWLNEKHKISNLTLSICTGAMMLGKIGLLDEKEYTTHHLVFDDMLQIAPKGIPVKNKRFVESGNIFTAAGISAGIDLSLYIVEKLFGKKVSDETAKYMEYGN